MHKLLAALDFDKFVTFLMDDQFALKTFVTLRAQTGIALNKNNMLIKYNQQKELIENRGRTRKTNNTIHLITTR